MKSATVQRVLQYFAAISKSLPRADASETQLTAVAVWVNEGGAGGEVKRRPETTSID
jgi:hypothetical protein